MANDTGRVEHPERNASWGGRSPAGVRWADGHARRITWRISRYMASATPGSFASIMILIIGSVPDARTSAQASSLTILMPSIFSMVSPANASSTARTSAAGSAVWYFSLTRWYAGSSSTISESFLPLWLASTATIMAAVMPPSRQNW